MLEYTYSLEKLYLRGCRLMREEDNNIDFRDVIWAKSSIAEKFIFVVGGLSYYILTILSVFIGVLLVIDILGV